MSRASRCRGPALGRLLVVALVAFAALPSLAAAWSPPTNVSPAGLDSTAPQAGLADDGTAIFAWVRDDGLSQRIQLRTRSVAGALGPVQDISLTGAPVDSLALDTNAAGQTAMAWRRHDGSNWRIELALRRVNGTLVGPVTISPAGEDATHPDIGIDGAGDLVAVWQRDGRIQMRTRIDGVLAPVADLTTTATPRLDPVVDVAASGEAAAAWRRVGTMSRIELAQISPTGTAGPATTLSTNTTDALSPDVGVADDGSAVAVWDRSTVVQMRPVDSAGSAGATRRLSRSPGSQPAVSVNGSGDAIAAFVATFGGWDRAQAVRRDAAGTYGERRNVSVQGENAASPEIELADDGRALTVWHRPEGISGRVQSRAIHSDDTFAAVKRLSHLGEFDGDPAVAVSQTGGSVTAWQRLDGGLHRVQTSVAAPIVRMDDPPITYTEGDPFLTLDSGMAVRDYDGQTLESATVKLIDGQPGDSLGSFDFGAVTWAWNDTTDEMTLSAAGPAPIGDFQAVLQTAFFDNSSGDPDTTPRSVEVTVNDGLFTSAPQTRTIDVIAQNSAPVHTVPGTQTFDEDTTLAFSTGNGNAISVADGDAGGADVRTTLAATQGTLSIVTTGLDFACGACAGDGTSDTTMTFEGTLAEINAALQTLVYTPNQHYNGAADLTVTTDDLGNTGAPGALSDSDTINFTITAVNDGPVNTVPAAQAVDEDTALTLSTGNGNALSTADPDAGASNVRATLDVDNGTLTLAGIAGLDFACGACAGDGAGDATMTFEATVAEVNTALDGLSYQGTPDFNGADTLTLTVDDLGNTGSGGALSDTDTVGITVNPVNDAPVADDETFNGNDSAHGNTTMQVDDPDDDKAAPTHPHTEITGDILAGDTDVETASSALTVTPETKATNDGGSVTIEADGDFVFYPKAVTSCTDTSDSFNYTLEDNEPGGELTDTGTVTVAIAGCVWYVNNNDLAGNAGTSSEPFDTIAQAEAASAANHTVFVFDGNNTATGYDTGFAMDSGERLIGEHEGLTVDPDQGGPLTADALHPSDAGKHPTITATGEDVVALDDANEIRGVTLDPAGAFSGIAGASGDTGGGTIDDVNVIDTAVAATNAGLELISTTGTFNVSNLTISNQAAAGQNGGSKGVELSNAGTVNFNPIGTISIVTTGGAGLSATNTNLGTSTFDTITTANSSTGGVEMVNTTNPIGGSTTFGDLSLTTTSGSVGAFDVSSGGNIVVPSGGSANVHATGGPGVDVSSTNGAQLNFDDVDSTNSSSDGINIDGIGSGVFNASSGDIGNAAGVSVDINDGDGAITYPGNLNNGTGNAIEITSRDGGAVTLNGPISDTNDAGGGVLLTSNTGGSTTLGNATKQFNTGTSAAVSFTGSDGHSLTLSGGGLDIDTTSGAGLAATTSGTIEVTGSANTIDTTTGRGLDIIDTDIVAADVTFQRIRTDGAPTGIRLSNTGSAGNLAVTGSGGTCTNANTTGCSGGEIENSSGVDSASVTPDGTGIVLNNTLAPSFDRMWIHDHTNYGIRGTSVTGFSLTNSVINGTNGNNDTNDDSSVLFWNESGSALTGSASVTDTHIQGGAENNFRVRQTAGTLNRLTFDRVTIGANSTLLGNDGIGINGGGTSTMNVTLQNSALTSSRGDLFQMIAGGSGGGDLDMYDNDFSNNHPAISTGGGGVVLQGGLGASTFNIDVDNDGDGTNTFRDALGHALIVEKTIGPGSITGEIDSAQIGLAGTANSGSLEGDGLKIEHEGQGTLDLDVTGNQIRQYNNFGMELKAGDGLVQGGTMNLDVTGNTVANPGTANPGVHQGILLNSGVTPSDSFQVCLNLKTNTASNSGRNGGHDLRVRQRQNTTVRLPGYGGGTTDDTAVANFLLGQNTALTASATHETIAPAGGGFIGGGAVCS